MGGRCVAMYLPRYDLLPLLLCLCVASADIPRVLPCYITLLILRLDTRNSSGMHTCVMRQHYKCARYVSLVYVSSCVAIIHYMRLVVNVIIYVDVSALWVFAVLY